MAIPSTRDEFKSYCLRALGSPATEVNVTEEQVDDRVDEALKYYADYHYDGSEKIYYKHQITANNRQGAIFDLSISAAGSLYSNTDTVVFSGGGGANAAASIVTNGNGAIIAATLTDNGLGYATLPNVSITTSTGSGATLTPRLGGFIQMPENILGAIRIFPLTTSYGSGNMFSVEYQMALSDIWNLTSFELHPYYIMRSQLELINQMLVGEVPIRYNRHVNKLYLDMDWNRVQNGAYVIVEAYMVVDPDEFTDVWNDRWLYRYCTQLIKQQWGTNLKKYSGMQLPGGVMFNGQIIYDEASMEIAKLEAEMINSFSLPVYDMMG